MPRVFLSHSHKDEPFVERLATDLHKNGIEVWYDKWDLDIGHDLTVRIQEGLSESDYLALVLSPAAVESAWVQKEWTTALYRELNLRKVIVLPILYQKCVPPLLLQDKVYCDFTNEAEYEDPLQDLLRFLRGESKRPGIVEQRAETAVEAREESLRRVEEFFGNAEFGPAHGVQIRLAACPVVPGRFKDRMLEKGFPNWLDANRPMGPTNPREGMWKPFLTGWRFLGHPDGTVSGKQYEIRVFHNGAVCLNLDPRASSTDGRVEPCIDGGCLLLDRVERKLQYLFVQYSATIFDGLAINGPVVTRFWLFHARGLRAATNTQDYDERQYIRSQIAESGMGFIGRKMYRVSPEEPGQPYTDGQDMVFDEGTSVEELVERPEDFVSRLMTRIRTAFGLWETADEA